MAIDSDEGRGILSGMNRPDGNDYVTKGYLRGTLQETLKTSEDLVITEMSKVFRDGMQLIAQKFDDQNKHIDRREERLETVEATTNRMESKLDPTITLVDDHAVRLKRSSVLQLTA